ncbi:MAG: hypothetical protein ACRDZP_04575 [Acidimicrobiales bacterium]
MPNMKDADLEETMTAGRPSLRPALLLILIPAVILAFGVALALAPSSGGRDARTIQPGPSRVVAGSNLRAEPAASVIAHIARGGEPPPDVVAAVDVPAGSRYLAKLDSDAGVSQFDRSVLLSIDEPEADVRTFYLRDLSAHKWVLNGLTAPAKGSTQIIAQRNGSDGYEWRLGIALKSVSTLVTPALGGAGGAPVRTKITVRLFQIADAS